MNLVVLKLYVNLTIRKKLIIVIGASPGSEWKHLIPSFSLPWETEITQTRTSELENALFQGIFISKHSEIQGKGNATII